MTQLVRHTRFAALVLLALAFTTAVTQAVITKLTPLAEVVESDQFIFVAKAEKLDADNKDRPTATFKLQKKLKGEVPFDRIPVNMTGDDEAKKNGDTKAMFERLDTSRELVFFVRKQGKLYNAKVFVEGTWFSVYGQLDADGKTIRWAFLHGEPYLRRTFKGTSTEMVKTIEDAIAKKAKPPEPDEKEKPGYGPVVEKKDGRLKGNGGSNSLALLGVIPSFVLVGPLAIVAALFPGVFARMAVGMKRWRAFLVVASINSTLALIYWAVLTYFPQWIPSGRWFGVQMLTVYMMGIALVGLVWSGRRYRRMAAEEPTITHTPGKIELLSLLGLTAFAAVCTALTVYFANWNATIELPLREFTFIGIALSVATVYAGYRMITKSADVPSNGTEPPLRLSIPGESVGLAVLVLCGLCAVIQMGVQSAPQVASGTQKGEGDEPFGPQLIGGPVVISAFEVEDGKNVPTNGRVMSNLALDGNRLLFGIQVSDGGRLFCMNRDTGRVEWTFDAPDLKPVYCTPTVANGKVYCGEGLHENSSRRLFCVNASDGNPAWKEPFKTASHTEGAPTVVGGKVYFPAGDDGLYCADANTGAKLWQFPGGRDKGIHIDAAPAVANGTVFVGSGLYSYVAVALDANTGNEKWRTNLELRAFGAPLVSGSKVFYGIGTGNLSADIFDYPEEGQMRDQTPAGAVVCLDAATGREEWRCPLPRSVHTGLAADAFSVYAGCRNGCVFAIDRKSGKVRWQVGIGSAVLSAPAVAESGGVPLAVYAVSREGRVFCLNPQTGAEIWSWADKPLPGYQWVRDDHDIFCAPLIVTTPTATGSKRTIYIGGMLVDKFNPGKKTVAVFKFEDAIGE